MRSYIKLVQPKSGKLFFSTKENTINASAYAFNNEITYCELPISCEYIERAAFKYCTKLQFMVIPDSVVEIEAEAFSYCRKITEIRLPSKLTQIASNLFDGCDLLNRIEIPADVKIIDSLAFNNCCSLKQVVLNNSLTTIKMKAFAHCYSIEEIFIPDNVEIIESQAFYDCTALKKIHIPNNIKYIGNDAFKGCKKLEVIENAEKVVTINRDLIYSLPKIKEKIIFPVGFEEGVFFEINNETIENSEELKFLLDEELLKYHNRFSIYNLFYDVVVKRNSISTVSKRYNIPELYIKEKLAYLARKIRIKYLDNYYVPLNHKLLHDQEKIKELFGLTKLDLSYMAFKIDYLSDDEILQVPDELQQKIELIRKEEEQKRILEEAKKNQAEKEREEEHSRIRNKEIEKIPCKFFQELNSLLELNQTDSMTIQGICYNYIISRSMKDNIVSIEKRNAEALYILDFDLQTKEINYFNFKDNSNRFAIEDYKGGLFFIYEFYNLFIHRYYSHVLTNLYNLLTKNDTDYFYFSTYYENIFYKVQKISYHTLLLLKIDSDKNIIKKLAVRKIEEIPMWFNISKTSRYTCITQVKRLITFFYKESKNPLLDSIFQRENISFSDYNPYSFSIEKTSAEKIIADFEENCVEKYLEIPVHNAKVNSPLCDK